MENLSLIWTLSCLGACFAGVKSISRTRDMSFRSLFKLAKLHVGGKMLLEWILGIEVTSLCYRNKFILIDKYIDWHSAEYYMHFYLDTLFDEADPLSNTEDIDLNGLERWRPQASSVAESRPMHVGYMFWLILKFELIKLTQSLIKIWPYCASKACQLKLSNDVESYAKIVPYAVMNKHVAMKLDFKLNWHFDWVSPRWLIKNIVWFTC